MGAEASNLPTAQASSKIFCVTYNSYNTIQVVDANRKIIDIIKTAILSSYPLGASDKSSNPIAHDFILEGRPYSPDAPAEDNFFGRLSACVILEHLLKRNCQLILGSGLLRDTVSCSSSWFFEEGNFAKIDTSVCCISLYSTDSFQLLRFPKSLLRHFEATVKEHWALGIQEALKDTFSGHEIVLKGAPWVDGGERGIEARKLLLNVVRMMAAHGWFLCLCTNIRTQSDSLFFRHRLTSENQLSLSQLHDSFLLSFNSDNLLWTIDASAEVNEVVSDLVTKHWKPGISKKSVMHGAAEFELSGSPWQEDDEDELTVRCMVTAFLQKLRSRGWFVVETLFLYRRRNDKAVFFFAKTSPSDLTHWCVNLHHRNVMRFVQIPASVLDAFRDAAAEKYTPGIKESKKV